MYQWALRNQKGFTLVELLIVIVAIAILAAISIVAYNGIQNRANDSAVTNDLAQLSQRLQMYQIDNGMFATTPALTTGLGFYASKNAYAVSPQTSYNLVYCMLDAQYQHFAVAALSKGGTIFMISDASATVSQYTGSWQTSADTMCNALGSTWDAGIHNLRGYAANDTVTGPWRTWAGGN